MRTDLVMKYIINTGVPGPWIRSEARAMEKLQGEKRDSET